jgi:hypothetical protein
LPQFASRGFCCSRLTGRLCSQLAKPGCAAKVAFRKLWLGDEGRGATRWQLDARMRPKGYGLQILCGAEGADYGRDVALIGVDLSVEVAHIGGGEFAGEIA